MVPFLRYFKPNFSKHWGNWLLAPLLAFMVGFVPSSAFAAFTDEDPSPGYLWHSPSGGDYPTPLAAAEAFAGGSDLCAFDKLDSDTYWVKRTSQGWCRGASGRVKRIPDPNYVPPDSDCPESGSLQMFQGYAASKSACSDLNGSNTEFGHDSCGYKITTSSVTENPVTCSSPGMCFNEGKYLCTFTAAATGQETELGAYDFPEPEPEDPDGEGEDSGNSDGDPGSEDDTDGEGTGTDPDDTDGTDNGDEGDQDDQTDGTGDSEGDSDSGNDAGSDDSSSGGDGDGSDTGGDTDGDPDEGNPDGGDPDSDNDSGGSTSGGNNNGSDGSNGNDDGDVDGDPDGSPDGTGDGNGGSCDPQEEVCDEFVPNEDEYAFEEGLGAQAYAEASEQLEELISEIQSSMNGQAATISGGGSLQSYEVDIRGASGDIGITKWIPHFDAFDLASLILAVAAFISFLILMRTD